MVSDEHPTESVSPRQLGGTTVLINLFVADVDALFERALAAGATVDRPLADQFTGARNGKLKDPFGHVWLVQTQVEAVSDEEVQRRFKAMTT